MTNLLAHLKTKIDEHRACGVIHLFQEKIPSDFSNDSDLLNDCALKWGFEAPPSIEVSSEEALKIAKNILMKDLAYSYNCIPDQYAQEYVNEFLSAFSAKSRFFTNAEFKWPEAQMKQWYPITKATFDTGIFVVDSQLIGALWIEDED